MAKKAARKGRKPAATKAPSAAKAPSGDLARYQQLAAEAEAQRKKAIEVTRERLAKAHADVKALEAHIAHLQSELATLGAAPAAAKAVPAPKAAAPKAPAKPARKAAPKAAAKAPAKKRGKPGRKPRVSSDVKRQHIAAVLKASGRGIMFADLRKALLARKTSDGVAVFSTPDIASSKAFGKRFLPKGYKVVGERRAAKVVKG